MVLILSKKNLISNFSPFCFTENAKEENMKELRNKKIPPMLKKEHANQDLELVPQGHSKVGVQVKKNADVIDKGGGI